MHRSRIGIAPGEDEAGTKSAGTTIWPRCFREGDTISGQFLAALGGDCQMSVYKLTAGVVGLLLAAVVVTAVVGVANRVRGPGGRPRKSSRQQPIQFGLRARAVALRMPMAGTAGEADLHSWSAAGLKHRLEKRCPFSYLISVLVWWNVPSGPGLSYVSLMGFLE